MHELLVLGAAALVSASALAHAQRQAAGGQEPVTFTVTGTYSDGTTRDITERVYHVVANGDYDGDGRPDEGRLTVICSGGRALSATFTSAREAGSGMATGRRQHTPIPIRRSAGSGPQAPQSFRGGWDMAPAKGGRGSSASSGARVVTFGSEFGGCR